MILIWDFNGTLLDDTQVCIDCMNIMLGERNLPPLDLERYREIFTFPVRDYYISLGFDFEKEPFEIPAHRFIDLYREAMHLAPLQKDAVELLDHFKKLGFQQIILSAMEEEFLIDTLKSKGILEYFDRVAGITNHLGEGKLEIARELVTTLGKDPGNICMIGDTVHDFEVAQGSGIPCILVAKGHQSFDRLKELNCEVLEDLKSLNARFIGNYS
jgi:phosphoglycolate phosphatase